MFDQVKQKEGLTSDAKLASALGVTRGYICSVRKERKGVSLALAEKIYSLLGREIELTELQGLFVPVKVRTRIRNLVELRRYAIQRANGRCQLCGSPAPFLDSEGNPYLEVHHVIPIREYGTDSINNLVALCPNCNRKMQFNPTAADKRKLKKLAENTVV